MTSAATEQQEPISNIPVDAPDLAAMAAIDVGSKIIELDPDDILLDENQNMRRYHADSPSIRELATDIISRGQIQPVLLRKTKTSKHTLVFGFQRVRAIQHINENKLHNGDGPMKVKAMMVDEMSDIEALAANVAENMKRKDLSPIDLAFIVKTLSDAGITGKAIAKQLGKSTSWVSNMLELNALRPNIQKSIHSGEIGYTTARELVGMSDEDQDQFIKDFGKTDGGKRRGKGKGKARDDARKKKRGKGKEAVNASLTMKEFRDLLGELAGTNVAKGQECKYSEKVQGLALNLISALDGRLAVKALANRIDKAE